MNAIWQLPFVTWPAWDNIRAAGCNRIYFQTRREVYEDGQVVGFEDNPQATDEYRQGVMSQRFQYGLVRQPAWDGISDHDQLAALVDEDIARATPNKYVACPYMLNMEFGYRDPVWLVALFKAIRKLRPTRRLSWVFEPMQGGWIRKATALVDYINNVDPNLVAIAETFGGNMDPYPLQQVRDDLLWSGIKPERCLLCYDAAKPRPAGWNGFLFQAGRLVV